MTYMKVESDLTHMLIYMSFINYHDVISSTTRELVDTI